MDVSKTIDGGAPGDVPNDDRPVNEFGPKFEEISGQVRIWLN